MYLAYNNLIVSEKGRMVLKYVIISESMFSEIQEGRVETSLPVHFGPESYLDKF